MVDKKRLTGYLKTVVEQSAAAENMQYEDRKIWYKIIGDDLLFHMEDKSNSKKNDNIVRRAIYRINKNLYKNFQLHPYFPGHLKYNKQFSDKYKLQSIFIPFDWMKALDEVEIFGESFLILAKWDILLDADCNYDMKQKMKDIAHIKEDVLVPYFFNIYKAYMELYQRSPIEIWEWYMEHGSLDKMHSPVFIESVAQDDFDNHDCFYHSVCKYATRNCGKRNNCHRPTKLMNDAISIRTWNKLVQEKMEKEYNRYRKLHQ